MQKGSYVHFLSSLFFSTKISPINLDFLCQRIFLLTDNSRSRSNHSWSNHGYDCCSRIDGVIIIRGDISSPLLIKVHPHIQISTTCFEKKNNYKLQIILSLMLWMCRGMSHCPLNKDIPFFRFLSFLFVETHREREF